MTRFVVDASVVMSWCFPDEQNPYARDVLRVLREADMVVPSVWSLEIANALVVAERRKRLGAADIARFVTLLEGLAPAVDRHTAAQALGETLSLARKHRLSAYDAAYLELAMREGLPLATLDQDLKKAARTAGVSLARA